MWIGVFTHFTIAILWRHPLKELEERGLLVFRQSHVVRVFDVFQHIVEFALGFKLQLLGLTLFFAEFFDGCPFCVIACASDRLFQEISSELGFRGVCTVDAFDCFEVVGLFGERTVRFRASFELSGDEGCAVAALSGALDDYVA
jgi:hypothetical protein